MAVCHGAPFNFVCYIITCYKMPTTTYPPAAADITTIIIITAAQKYGLEHLFNRTIITHNLADHYKLNACYNNSNNLYVLLYREDHCHYNSREVL